MKTTIRLLGMSCLLAVALGNTCRLSDDIGIVVMSQLPTDVVSETTSKLNPDSRELFIVNDTATAVVVEINLPEVTQIDVVRVLDDTGLMFNVYMNDEVYGGLSFNNSVSNVTHCLNFMLWTTIEPTDHPVILPRIEVEAPCGLEYTTPVAPVEPILQDEPGVVDVAAVDPADELEVVGAVVGQEVDATPTAYSNTVCEGDTMTIECFDGATILVYSAMYGRVDESICPAEKPARSENINCPNDVTAIVVENCDGKSNCTRLVNNNMFGGDPCTNTEKYLVIEYSCVEPLDDNLDSSNSRSSSNSGSGTVDSRSQESTSSGNRRKPERKK